MSARCEHGLEAGVTVTARIAPSGSSDSDRRSRLAGFPGASCDSARESGQSRNRTDPADAAILPLAIPARLPTNPILSRRRFNDSRLRLQHLPNVARFGFEIQGAQTPLRLSKSARIGGRPSSPIERRPLDPPLCLLLVNPPTKTYHSHGDNPPADHLAILRDSRVASAPALLDAHQILAPSTPWLQIS